jgi:hypothetical protein
MTVERPVIEAESCGIAEAGALWHRCLAGLDDPAQYFGPDVNRELHPGEQYYRLTANGQVFGLGWMRRFTRNGYIRSYGQAFFSEARGRGFARGASTAMLRRIFREHPECTTVLAMIYSTNPDQRWRLTKEGGRPQARYVGEILDAAPDGVSLHIVQIQRPTAKPLDFTRLEEPTVAEPYPEHEWRGAPHVHREIGGMAT